MFCLFQECNRTGTTHYVAFTYWILSLSYMHLHVLHVLSWLDSSFLFSAEYSFVHSFREGNGIPLQYSCLENPMDREPGGLQSIGVTKSRARLSDFPFTFHFHALEKVVATHSSVLAWRIPGTGEPGGLPSMGSHRVRHD